MDDLTKYEDEVLGPNMTGFAQMPEVAGTSAFDMIASVLLRRWRTALIVFSLICGIGLSVIWLGISPAYEVTGAIRVAPILSNILTGEADRGEVSNYQSFMNTQAEMMTSTQVIQRVADDLTGKNLSFFENMSSDMVDIIEHKFGSTSKNTDYAACLKMAINNGVIVVAPAKYTELIKITMESGKPEESRVIVDTFIRAYMAIEGLRSTQDEDQTLDVLEAKRRTLAEKLQGHREAIRQLAQEYGTESLDTRQNMMLEGVSSILSELTRVESQRISLESRIQQLNEQKDSAMPDEWLKQRTEYINSDPTVQEVIRNVVRLEQDLMIARQTMKPENPILQQKEEFLDSFKKRLEEKREEVGKNFDAMMDQEVTQARSNELLKIQNELDMVVAYEKRLREKLDTEDEKAIEMGRKQLKIKDMEYQYQLDEDMYDTVMRRIQTLEMERKRPARVSVAYHADIASIRDKRIKYTFALAFMALVGAMGVAFLKDKTDPSLQSPEDIVNRIGIRLIGTTTSPRTIKKAFLPRQLTEDYQTIRANLGLLDGGGMPKKLVVTSPGMRDGKTTFSVNLATSLSRAGKKVLLIDADMRKPDIGRLLNVPKDTRRLQDVLMGHVPAESVLAVVSPGLHVLSADMRNSVDPYELLVLPETAELINVLAEQYDHVIIDTPPVLAFPDALILAKISGAVILTSFAGHTTGPDLKETKDRLTQIDVKILGTVMSNVHVGHTYYRYGYNYYSQGGRTNKNRRRHGADTLLLPSDKSKEDTDQPTS